MGTAASWPMWLLSAAAVVVALARTGRAEVPAGVAGRYSVADGLVAPARGTLLVIDASGRVEVPGVCPSRRARFASSDAGTSVHVRWPRCTGSRRAVRLTARLAAGGLTGRVRVGQARRPFTAAPSTCQDGVLDVESEACDTRVSPFCASGGYCAVLSLPLLGDQCSCHTVPDPVDEVEPNDDAATAMPIDHLGSLLLRGSIADAADVDYFTFTEGAFVAFVLDASGTGCDGIDPRLLLSTPGHEDVFSDDDVFGSCPVVGVGPRIGTGTPVEQRTLVVSSASGGPISAYTLRIEPLSGPP